MHLQLKLQFQNWHQQTKNFAQHSSAISVCQLGVNFWKKKGLIKTAKPEDLSEPGLANPFVLSIRHPLKSGNHFKFQTSKSKVSTQPNLTSPKPTSQLCYYRFLLSAQSKDLLLG